MNKRVLKPGKLKLGATIGLVSPAAPLAGLVRHRLDGCVTFLEKSGFKVRIGRHASSVTGYVSASAEDRAWDINEFFRSPEIDAIVCLIGGYHYNHVLPHLDLELIRSNPKIFIGYSDATVVQMALWSALHMVTFSGPAGLTQFAEYPAPLPYTLEYFQKATASNVPVGSVAASSEYTDEFLNWFGKEDQTRARKLKANRGYVTLREGQCSGRLLGGCLSSMLHLRGTKFWPDFNGALLCLEVPEGAELSRGESISLIDMHLADLELSGLFEKAGGLLFGRLYNTPPEEERGIFDLLLKYTSLKPIPIMANVDFGHTDPMITIPMGCMASMDAGCGRFEITESGVVD